VAGLRSFWPPGRRVRFGGGVLGAGTTRGTSKGSTLSRSGVPVALADRAGSYTVTPTLPLARIAASGSRDSRV